MSEFLNLNRRIRLFLWRNQRFILLVTALLVASLLVALFALSFWFWGVPVGVVLVMLVVCFID